MLTLGIAGCGTGSSTTRCSALCGHQVAGAANPIRRASVGKPGCLVGVSRPGQKVGPECARQTSVTAPKPYGSVPPTCSDSCFPTSESLQRCDRVWACSVSDSSCGGLGCPRGRHPPVPWLPSICSAVSFLTITWKPARNADYGVSAQICGGPDGQPSRGLIP